MVSVHGKTRSLHTVMLEAFVGPRPRRNMEGRHLNDVKSDNRIENLEWGTRKQNAEDACRNGTLRTKLTASTAQGIVFLKDWGWSVPQIARLLEVGQSAVWYVLTGKTWSHVTGIVAAA